MLLQKMHHIKNLVSSWFANDQVNNDEVIDEAFRAEVKSAQEKLKALQFHDAIQSIHELTLRARSDINYNEEVLKKLYSLEASGDEQIAEKVEEKMLQIRKVIAIRHRRIFLLKRFLTEAEKASEKHAYVEAAKKKNTGRSTNPIISNIQDRIGFYLQRIEKSQEVGSYVQAIKWIEGSLRKQRFEDAFQGIKELMNKNGRALLTCSEIKEKIMTLENSNIRAMEEQARNKKKDILAKERMLLERKEQLVHLQDKIEEAFGAFQRKEGERKVKNVIQGQAQAIDEFIKKRDYTQAYILAKKAVNEFPGNEAILKQFLKAQKFLEAEKEKKKSSDDQKNKNNKLLREMGIEVPADEEEDKKTAFEKTFGWVSGIRQGFMTRRDMEKKKSTLSQVERLLLRAGSIEKINMSMEQQSTLFSSIRKEVTKDVSGFDLPGFDVFGKSIGAESIIGDAFGCQALQDGRSFLYFGDAMGHGIQAGFTTALLTKGFLEHVQKIHVLQDLVFTINNDLKAKIKGKAFITAMFLEWNPETGMVYQTGAGHPPLFIYRKKTKSVEQIRSSGLPLGVRMITNPSSIKIREIPLAEGDIFLGYTDGITEMKSPEGEMFGIDRLQDAFLRYAQTLEDPKGIYHGIMEELTKRYAPGVAFADDASLFIFSRNKKKDIITNKEEVDQMLSEQ